MSEAVRRRPLTSEVHVESQVSPRKVCCTKNGTRAGFSTNTSVFPLSSCLQCSILVFIYTFLLPQRQDGEAWEPSKEERSFSKSGIIGQRRT